MDIRHLVMLLIFAIGNCRSVIILDRGNPARHLRESYLESAPNYHTTAPPTYNVPASSDQNVLVMLYDMEFIVEELTSYNEAITISMLTVVKDVSPPASVNLCRLARTRMSALRIIDSFRSLRIEAATISLNGDRPDSSILRNKMGPVIADAATEFVQMEQDLHHYDETKLGNSPMIHFGRAVKDFNALQIAFQAPKRGFLSQHTSPTGTTSTSTTTSEPQYYREKP